jgi:hypothetical protein
MSVKGNAYKIVWGNPMENNQLEEGNEDKVYIIKINLMEMD